MDAKITRTRVIIPQRRPDQLSRPRVLKRLLDQDSHKLLIVVAPPGYGKTTLLIDFAARSPHPTCWYAIDSLDQYPSRFFAHLVAAIEEVFVPFGRESRSALQELMANDGELIDLVPTIVNELYYHVQERFTIVLDDFHLVQENERIQQFLNAFIQQVEDTCQVILASRCLIRLPDLPLMVARSLVGGVSMEDLCFQTDEIQALMAQNYNEAISDEAALKLSDKTEGWITGLLLSTELTQNSSLDSNAMRQVALQRVTGVDLYDYLAQQVFEQQRESMQKFLLYSSLFGEFNETLCQQILIPEIYPPDTKWSALMNSVVTNNLFIQPVGNEAPWFRYHSLFQEFLSRRLHDEYPEQADIVLDKLANYYKQDRIWEKAYEVRKEQGKPELIAEVIEMAIPTLMQNCQMSLCSQWVDELPVQTLDSHPLLLAAKGYEHKSIDLESSLSMLNQAVESLEERQNTYGYVYILVWRAQTHRIAGQLPLALQDADLALSKIEQLVSTVDNSSYDLDTAACILNENGSSYPETTHIMIYAEALAAKGIILCMSGQLSDGVEYLAKAVRVYDELSESARGALVLTDLATANVHMGNYQEARVQFHSALERTGNHSRQRLRIQVLNNLGGLYYLSGDYQKSSELLHQALGLARTIDEPYLQAICLTTLGELLVDLGDVDAARERFREVMALIEGKELPHLVLHIEVNRAKLAHMEGDLAEAFSCLDRVGQAILGSHGQPEWYIYQMSMGLFHFVQGNNHQAATMFSDALQGLTKAGQRIEELQTRLLLAGVHYRLEDNLEAIVQIEKSSSIVSDLSVWQPAIIAGRYVVDMLDAIGCSNSDSKNADSVAFCTNLRDRINHFEESVNTLRRQAHIGTLEAETSEAMPGYVLNIRTLGHFSVTYHGISIHNWSGKSNIERDLFLCLVAHSDGLTKEEIGTLFWPDAAPTELKTRFKNAIYRIRKALSADIILFDNERYRFNREISYQCDAEAFEAAIVAAKDERTTLHKKETYQKALALYKGEYLADVDAMWAWLERERLSQMYVTATLELAELHLDYGENIEALQLCQRLLTHEPCLEEAHRVSMRIHAANGNRAALVRQFELCQQCLESEFGTAPSEQTKTLFRSLTS